jgi:hypothetical protein
MAPKPVTFSAEAPDKVFGLAVGAEVFVQVGQNLCVEQRNDIHAVVLFENERLFGVQALEHRLVVDDDRSVRHERRCGFARGRHQVGRRGAAATRLAERDPGRANIDAYATTKGRAESVISRS